MIVAPATMDDVEFVLSHLSAQHRAELSAAGAHPDMVMRKFEELVAHGRAETAWIDEKPAAVFGATVELGHATTYFITTNAYFRAGLPAIRHARAYIRKVADVLGPLTMATRSKYPGLVKWLKLIGYDEFHKEGDLRVFVHR